MDRVVVYDVPDEGKKCLGRDYWVFVYFEHRGLMLDYYAHEERDSLRKKFRPTRAYNRLSHNRNRDYRIEAIPEEEIVLPDWVKDRAKEMFCAALKVGKWDR